MRTYSTRERVLLGFLALVCLSGAGFWTFMLVSGPGFRDSLPVWAATLGLWGGFGLCLKIVITGRSTPRFEQDAVDALAGRSLPRDSDQSE